MLPDEILRGQPTQLEPQLARFPWDWHPENSGVSKNLVYGLAYCGGVVGAESVCTGLFDENSMIARTFFIGEERPQRAERPRRGRGRGEFDGAWAVTFVNHAREGDRRKKHCTGGLLGLMEYFPLFLNVREPSILM
jgi:hypothetical protein